VVDLCLAPYHHSPLDAEPPLPVELQREP